LPWLAGWLALTLHPDLDVAKQRVLTANVGRLYRWRGTKKNLEDLLVLVLGGTVRVTELHRPELQIEVHSTIDVDTWVEGSAPHLFHVRLAAPEPDLDDPGALQRYKERQEELARSVIEFEKPAHTDYSLEVVWEAADGRGRSSPATVSG